MDGILNFDKPVGLTSAAAVNRVKRMIPRGVKIGHAGTLDPFATGVLLLLIGKGTKCCERLMNAGKEYVTTIKLGTTTETLDPESPEIVDVDAAPVSREAVEASFTKFTGLIQQQPPVYSALKVNGRRACDLAREGKPPELASRGVRIDAIELLNYVWPMLELRIVCGRGTYIRSLARDIGNALGTSGYLTALRRTRIGPFPIDQSVTMEGLTPQTLADHLRPLWLLEPTIPLG